MYLILLLWILIIKKKISRDCYDLKSGILTDRYLKTEYMFKGRGFGYIWNKIYKKSSIQNIRFETNLNYVEDLVCNLKVLKNTREWLYTDNVYYNYRRGNIKSLSYSKNRDLSYNIMSIFLKMGVIIIRI